MPNPLDMVGRRYGKAEVVARAASRKGRGFWVCRCDCGTTFEVRHDAIVDGHATHCGCSPPSGPRIDLTGQTFGRLTVLRYAEKRKSGHYWVCRCECGEETTTLGSNLRSGHAKSCGCVQKEKAAAQATVMGRANRTHGAIDTPEYVAWRNMRRRCLDEDDASYAHYGERGITVCDRWLDFENFIADMGPKPGKEYTLDRIDVNKGYEPGNCRWTTQKVQQRNRRWHRLLEYKGETKCMGEWAEIADISLPVLWQRINRGWPVEQAMTTPSRRGYDSRAKQPTITSAVP